MTTSSRLCYNLFVDLGQAPIIKNGNPQLKTAKGMTPIEKNIDVVDEHGNRYEATYPKRARGLVKNGRARFISENTICLACPPTNKLEDYTMSEHTNSTLASPTVEYTIPYILMQIATLQKETAYLHEAIGKLSEMGDGDSGSPGNLQGQAKAMAFETIVQCRETTNQQLLRMYEKMYDNLITLQTDPENGERVTL